MTLSCSLPPLTVYKDQLMPYKHVDSGSLILITFTKGNQEEKHNFLLDGKILENVKE